MAALRWTIAFRNLCHSGATIPQKAKITIRHLGSHTSGLADAEEGDRPHEQLTGWQGDFWKRLPPPRDPFTIARDLTPVLFEPGSRRQYSNPAIGMLSYAITAALQDGPEKDIRTLLRERIMRPIGVPDGEWSCGYGQTVEVAGLPIVASWGGGGFTARAAARIGRLMLRNGEWEGRQLISTAAVRQTTESAVLPGDGGMGWWTNAGGRVAALPADAFWAAGAGGQVTLVVPSLQLIAVRNGDRLDNGDNDVAVEKHFFTPLLHAIHGKNSAPDERHSAVPASPVISHLEWAPAQTIIRQARGSDNWPMTWSDDDALYTAYGDGRGFEPFVPEKLSLGLARIAGTPPEIHGVNLRAPSIESTGDGQAGYKASGILMVDGVLYLLVRNVGNAQLTWSEDHGASWTFVDWKFTNSFGAPSFINFGKNYAAHGTNLSTSFRTTRTPHTTLPTPLCSRESRSSKFVAAGPGVSSRASTAENRFGMRTLPAANRYFAIPANATARALHTMRRSSDICWFIRYRRPPRVTALASPIHALPEGSPSTIRRSRGGLGRRFFQLILGTSVPANRAAFLRSG